MAPVGISRSALILCCRPLLPDAAFLRGQVAKPVQPFAFPGGLLHRLTMLAKEKKRAKWPRRRIVLPVFGLGFVLAAMWMAHIAGVVYVPQTPWYRAAEQFVRSSPEVSAEVGQVHKVQFIGGGASTYRSSDREDAQLKVRVTGGHGTAVVWMTLVKASGVWKPTAAALNDENGRRLNLKPATQN
jgi:hypothetical protein